MNINKKNCVLRRSCIDMLPCVWSGSCMHQNSGGEEVARNLESERDRYFEQLLRIFLHLILGK